MSVLADRDFYTRFVSNQEDDEEGQPQEDDIEEVDEGDDDDDMLSRIERMSTYV